MADPRTSDEGQDPELLEAIEVAARHVGPGRVAPAPDERATVPVVVRFDAPRAERRRFWFLTALLLLTAAGSAYLSLRPTRDPPPADVEADLRWAVAQVVRRVEVVRRQTGHLPAPQDLQGLVSDLVVYEPLGAGYWVVGQRGAVRVEYDGSIPLEQWTRLSTHAREPQGP